MAKPPFEVHSNSRRFAELFSAVIERNTSGKILLLDLGTGETGKDQTKRYPMTKRSDALYITLDIGTYKVPDILADASLLPFKENSFDLIFAESILEHIRPASKISNIADEVKRVLKPGGLLVGWVPSSYPWHGGAGFADDVRFTWEGIKTVLSPLNLEILEWTGGPVSVFLLNFPVNRLRELIQKMESRTLHRLNYRYRSFLTTGFQFLCSKEQVGR